MEFPISEIVASPIALVITGFVVGILGGFFGVGGGFLAGPLMFWIGVPINFVVGSDLAHMMGHSIVAARRHRALGHVDLRLAALMIIGTVPGVEIGAQIIESLKSVGSIEKVVAFAYIIILTAIGLFTMVESIRAIRMTRTDHLETEEVVASQSFIYRTRLLRIPPMIQLPISGVKDVSIWVIIFVGLVTGILAGVLGVGGGFLRMPLMVYLLGIPTHIAVGTDLFEIVVSAGFGTISHALKGNVDFLIAMTMLGGSAIGAQIGSAATRYFSGPTIRLLFSIMPLLAAVLVLVRLQG
jgi:uncharacterized membrane protein YfcA